jgi:hypothetical protein
VARDVLLDRRSRERGIIEPDAVDRLLRDHASGAVDGGDRIWSLLNLELWYRTFIDRGGIQTLGEPSRRPHEGTGDLAPVMGAATLGRHADTRGLT